MNALYYAVAVTVAGVKLKPKSKSSRMDKNANSNPAGDQLDRAVGVQPIRTKQTLCEKEIVMLRKKIGRLTNYCKDPTKRKARRVRFIIKDGDARATLQDLRMKLAAKSKKLRTENTKKVRFRNNKLFYENQKAFYSQLRGECTQSVTDPPRKKISKNYGMGYGEMTSLTMSMRVGLKLRKRK